MDSNSLNLLETCAGRAGLEYDPGVARVALQRAEREASGAWDVTWQTRLAWAGKDLGLHVSPARWSVREAIAAATPETPVVTFLPGDGGAAGSWLVLVGGKGRNGRLSGLAPGEPDRWANEAELTRLRGEADPRRPSDWAVVRSIAPCDGLRHHPGGEGHGHGHHHDSPSPVRRLIGLMRPEARDLRAVMVFAVAVGLLSLATPLAIEAVVTTVAMNLLVQQLFVLSLVLLVCLAMAAALRGLQTYVAEVIQERVFVRVAADLAYRLPRVRADAFDREHGPELVNRFFDVLTVQKVGALLLLDGVAIVIQAAIGLLVLALYHPYLLGFDLVVLGAISYAVFQLGRGAVDTSIRESRAKYAVAGHLEELARHPLAYKPRGGTELAMDRTEAFSRTYLAARREHFKILFRQIVFALGFQALATTALLGLGGWLVIQGQLTLGQLVAAELIVVTVIGSFAKLGKHLEGWYDLMAAVDKLGHLVDLPLERADGEEHREADRPASLRLRGVGFAYDGHGHALHGLELEVKPGERVAVVGPSGSGKSTLVDLLYGLRTPSAGRIELDGANLRDLRLEALRGHVAAVKGPDVIAGTILENVRMGRGSISLGQVREALDAVALLEDLSGLPDGLHTGLTSGGAPLSLGQARRLTLARAIAGRPRLLILDETLDGLDPVTRQRAVASLFDRSAPWTLLVVTNDQQIAGQCGRTLRLGDGDSQTPAAANGHVLGSIDHLMEVQP